MATVIPPKRSLQTSVCLHCRLSLPFFGSSYLSSALEHCKASSRLYLCLFKFCDLLAIISYRLTVNTLFFPNNTDANHKENKNSLPIFLWVSFLSCLWLHLPIFSNLILVFQSPRTTFLWVLWTEPSFNSYNIASTWKLLFPFYRLETEAQRGCNQSKGTQLISKRAGFKSKFTLFQKSRLKI